MAAEFALLLPVLAMLVALAVEGGNALRTYSIIQEASREGARMVLRQGDTANTGQLVSAMAKDLPGGPPATSVQMQDKKVTVEVTHAYQSIFSGPILQKLAEGPLELSARTSMPLP